MKGYKEFLKESSIGGYGLSSNYNKIRVYNDLTSGERKELDDYCKGNFSKTFMQSSWEEQSTARSIIWAQKNQPEEIEKQEQINKEF